MDLPNPSPNAGPGPAPNTGTAAASMPTSTSQSNAPPWSAQMTTFPVNTNAAPGSNLPQYSASTTAILERISGRGGGQAGGQAGSAAFEAKRAEIMQNYVTSDKLPTPPPITNTGRRGRGGRGGNSGTPRATAGGVHAGDSPARGSGRGRGRGRGRGSRGGRGGKRKRNDSEGDDDDDDNSDVSDSYTPLPTRTKSGRSVNKPVSFVPMLPEPSQTVKRRKSAKTLLAAKCKTCHRDVDPSNNRIVFCDACSTAYHQYCHDPPIDNDVVTVLEKEWLCGSCQRAKENVVVGTEQLVAVQNLSVDEKRAYFSSVNHAKLVDLLLHASIRHPDLTIFPPNIRALIPAPAVIPSQHQHQPPVPPQRFPQAQYAQPSAFQQAPHPSLPPPTNNHHPYSNFPSHSPGESAEAQLLGESQDLAGNQYDEDDGYDTDPPAHYPKPGNGLARTLRPESEDLNWMIDSNFEVFSHGWKGDGTGMGADSGQKTT